MRALLALLALVGTAHADGKCDALADSAKAEPKPATELALADCYARAGKLGSAWHLYAANAKSDPKAAAAAKKTAQKAAKLTLEVSPEVAGIRVFANAIDASSARTEPMPVDTGEVTIAATAPGYQTFRKTITVDDGETKTVAIRLVRSTKVAKLDPDDPDEPDPENARDPASIARATTVAPALISQIRIGADIGFLFSPSSERAVIHAMYARGRLFEVGLALRARILGDLQTSTGHELGGAVDGRVFAPFGSFCRAYGHGGVGGWSKSGVDGLVGIGGACQDWRSGTGYQVYLGLDKELGKQGGVGLLVGLELTISSTRE